MLKNIFLLICVPLVTVAQQVDNGIKFERELTWQQIKEKALSENKSTFLLIAMPLGAPVEVWTRKYLQNQK